jgi:RNA polymerase sigma-70 factor (ECF subfamily)
MYSPDELQSFTDGRLLALLQTDSEAAFSEIYRRYWLPLYNTVQKRVQDAALTEDILQNIFISFWHNRLRMQGDLQLAAYLFGAARNQVFKTLRQQNRLSAYYGSLVLLPMSLLRIQSLHDSCSKIFLAGCAVCLAKAKRLTCSTESRA